MLFGSIALAETGQTSGPAAGTNVPPSTGVTAGGAAGFPGLPGNKSGPAPRHQAAAQQVNPMEQMSGTCRTQSAKMTKGPTITCE
jgi:hypothetical protein